jgi:hypothetical protein
VFGPVRVLVPVHAAAAGAGHDGIDQAVAVDVADGLGMGVAGVVGVDDDVEERRLVRPAQPRQAEEEHHQPPETDSQNATGRSRPT